MKKTIALSQAALIALALSAPTAFANKQALLIGIDNYRHINRFAGDSKLDVKNMRELLEKSMDYSPDEIKTLTDQDATREAILDAFKRWLIDGTKPGDEVFFYYSGHGHYVEDQTPLEEDDHVDEILTAVDTYMDRDHKLHNYLLDDEINDLIEDLQDRKVMLVVDACHSGTITRSLFQEPADELVKKPVFEIPGTHRGALDKSVIIAPQAQQEETEAQARTDGFSERADNVITYSAVAPNELAMVDAVRRGGVFTNRFIDAIQHRKADANGDGLVAHSEVLEYTRVESQRYCDQHPGQCKLKTLSPVLEARAERLNEPASNPSQSAQPVTNGPQAQQQSEALLVHTNSAGLRLRIVEGNRFRLRDVMTTRIESQRGGYVTLLDINPGGEMTRIFPNEFSEKENKHGKIKAGGRLVVPDAYYGFRFTADEPVGKGRLIALVSEQPLQLSGGAFSKDLNVVPVDEGMAELQRIRQQLNRILTDADGRDRPLDWSVATFDYEIVR